jgi:thioredoxin 1
MKKIFTAIITTSLVLCMAGCEKKVDASQEKTETEDVKIVETVKNTPPNSEKKATMINIESVEQFDKVLKQYPKIVADFYADWCPPCKKLTPILESLSTKYSEDIQFIKVNVDKNPELSRRFKVSSIPLVIYFKNSEQFRAEVGLMPEAEITKILDSMK